METYLNYKGYRIPYNEQNYQKIKKDLTVKPFVIKDYDFNTKPFPVYRKNKKYIYLPKFYGFENYGPPKTNKERIGIDIDLNFNGKLKKEQHTVINNVLDKLNNQDSTVLTLRCGGGKCLAYNTPIIMYDGNVKMVQDIVVGDKIMGEDSTPRNVLTLATGREEMYEIKPTRGDSYIVNKSHILSLKYENTIVDISLKDYLKHTHKHNFKGFRVPLQFIKKDLPLDPYIIGIWLTDTHYKYNHIYNQNSFIITYLAQTLPQNDSYIDYTGNHYDYRIVGPHTHFLKKNIINKNNHIPHIFKINNSHNRLKLLAGIIDSIGFLGNKGYGINHRNYTLIKDIQFIAKSLGFSCYLKQNKKKYIYYRLNIVGNTSQIPCIIPNKKSTTTKQINNVLHYNIKVIPRGIARYYGFEIDGNRRFVLGSFDVTHNTVCALNIITKIKKKTIIVVHKEFLLNQWIERIQQFLPTARIGKIQQNVVDIHNKDIVIAMIQSITVRKESYPKETFDSFGFCAIDECMVYNQLVITDQGPKKIGYLYNLWKKNIPNINVLSYNQKLNVFEYKPITHSWEKHKKELIKINYGSGSIECTENHLILTSNGYKQAAKLKIGELIKCKSKESSCINFPKNTDTVKIKDIQNIINQGRGYNGKVYDIEVQDNHNFVLATDIKNNSGPIVHNCHRICSRTFSKALFQVATKKILGLSATPHRKDGLSKVLTWFLADITQPLQSENKLKPTVKFVIAQYKHTPTINYNMRGKINLPNIVTQISLDPTRNNQIINEIIDYNNQKRKILVLTERRQQCFNLDSLLPNNIQGGVYVGGMKEEDLNISNTKDVIFATYSMAAEGYDNKELDTLIMATGRSDIEQIVGRIMRQINPNLPLIVDFNDNIEGLQSQAKKRESFYKKNGYVDKLRKQKTQLQFIEDDDE